MLLHDASVRMADAASVMRKIVIGSAFEELLWSLSRERMRTERNLRFESTCNKLESYYFDYERFQNASSKVNQSLIRLRAARARAAIVAMGEASAANETASRRASAMSCVSVCPGGISTKTCAPSSLNAMVESCQCTHRVMQIRGEIVAHGIGAAQNPCAAIRDARRVDAHPARGIDETRGGIFQQYAVRRHADRQTLRLARAAFERDIAARHDDLARRMRCRCTRRRRCPRSPARSRFRSGRARRACRSRADTRFHQLRAQMHELERIVERDCTAHDRRTVRADRQSRDRLRQDAFLPKGARAAGDDGARTMRSRSLSGVTVGVPLASSKPVLPAGPQSRPLASMTGAAARNSAKTGSAARGGSGSRERKFSGVGIVSRWRGSIHVPKRTPRHDVWRTRERPSDPRRRIGEKRRVGRETRKIVRLHRRRPQRGVTCSTARASACVRRSTPRARFVSADASRFDRSRGPSRASFTAAASEVRTRSISAKKGASASMPSISSCSRPSFA